MKSHLILSAQPTQQEFYSVELREDFEGCQEEKERFNKRMKEVWGKKGGKDKMWTDNKMKMCLQHLEQAQPTRSRCNASLFKTTPLQNNTKFILKGQCK